jgi:glycerol-3-phosphate dehydrogenase
MARTLTDVLERRSRLALFATAEAQAVTARVAAIVATELGWSAERVADESAAFIRQCEARLAWRDVATPSSAVAAAGRSA